MSSLTREILNQHTNVKSFSTDEDLTLFCYTTCTKNDPDAVKNSRGIVFKGDDLLITSFPYTEEYTAEEIPNDLDITGCRFFNSYEGCLIRVFYHDKWYISTNKKLNAFQSQWSSKESYGDIFLRALGKDKDTINQYFDETLNKEHKYMFLVMNTQENRIVCDVGINEPVYHVGTFTANNTLDLDEQIGIPHPEELEFNSIKDLSDYVQNVKYTKQQGVIIFHPGNRQTKILHLDYKYLYDVRGNEPSLKFRYLQVRMNQDTNGALRNLYPNFRKEFDDYENLIFDSAMAIYGYYVDRFISKKYITVNTDDYAVMKAAHSWYLSQPKKNKINYEIILDIINSKSATEVNRLIKNRKMGIQPTTTKKLLPLKKQIQQDK